MSRRPRILLTLSEPPFPMDGGKRLRAGATVRALTRVAEVDVLVLRPAELGPFSSPLLLGVRCEVTVGLPMRSGLGTVGRVIRSGLPWQMADRDYSRGRELIRMWSRVPYDVVWFGAADHAFRLGDAVTARWSIVDLDDVETSKITAFLSLPRERGLLPWFEHVKSRVDRRLWARAQELAEQRRDVVVVCSALDKARLGGSRVSVVPNTYPDPGPGVRQRPVSPPVVLLAGTWSYAPNVDAARFAACEILPRIRSAIGTARLRLVGRVPQALSGVAKLEGVEVVGPVQEMGPELEQASVALVPVRYGGGTRLKLIEAFAWGVPAVCTALGCEGLDLVDGHNVLMSDDAVGLAQACIRLIRNPAFAREIGDAGRRYYVRHHRPEIADEAVRTLVMRLLSS